MAVELEEFGWMLQRFKEARNGAVLSIHAKGISALVTDRGDPLRPELVSYGEVINLEWPEAGLMILSRDSGLALAAFPLSHEENMIDDEIFTSNLASELMNYYQPDQRSAWSTRDGMVPARVLEPIMDLVERVLPWIAADWREAKFRLARVVWLMREPDARMYLVKRVDGQESVEVPIYRDRRIETTESPHWWEREEFWISEEGEEKVTREMVSLSVCPRCGGRVVMVERGQASIEVECQGCHKHAWIYADDEDLGVMERWLERKVAEE